MSMDPIIGSDVGVHRTKSKFEKAAARPKQKTALFISSLTPGLKIFDLPHELIHDIHARAGNPLLAESCKALAHSLLPSSTVHASVRARYLLGQARVKLAKAATAAPTPDAAGGTKPRLVPTPAGHRKQTQLPRSSNDTAAKPPLCPHLSLATAALNLGLKTRLLDAQVVQFLDRLARPPQSSSQPVQVPVTNRGKWRAMPRWLAQRMLSVDTAQVDAALDLTGQLLARGMTIDTGYTVLKMVQQGKLDVLPKLKALGFPLDVKDGLVVEVAVKERHMDVVLYLLHEGIQPGDGALEVAIERVLRCTRPQNDDAEAMPLGHAAATATRGKRAAGQEPLAAANKRPRKTVTNGSNSVSFSIAPAEPTHVPSSLSLDEFCALLLTHRAPVSDKALAMAVMAYPALSKESIRQLLNGMRRCNQKPGKLAFEAATASDRAQADVIPLLIEFGGIPEFEQVQGVMARLFTS